MPANPQADEYRRRAVEVRAVARRLGAVSLGDVSSWAGADTWMGPGPDACRLIVDGDRQRLERAVDDLVERAWRLDRQAEAIEAAAALAALVTPLAPGGPR